MHNQVLRLIHETCLVRICDDDSASVVIRINMMRLTIMSCDYVSDTIGFGICFSFATKSIFEGE
jgi:hypothetical protein